MKFVIQRVSKATVIIDRMIYSSIDNGLLVLIGVGKKDDINQLDYYANKIQNPITINV